MTHFNLSLSSQRQLLEYPSRCGQCRDEPVGISILPGMKYQHNYPDCASLSFWEYSEYSLGYGVWQAKKKMHGEIKLHRVRQTRCAHLCQLLRVEVSLKTHRNCNVTSLTWCVKLMEQSRSDARRYGGSFYHDFLLNATLHFRFKKKMSFILLSSFSLFSAITD